MAGVKRKLHSYTDVHALHKELDEVSCPVCMDHPHNAVLLLCSSHDKGCRSYICDTSYRHSNCLDRFKKLHSESSSNAPNETPQLNLTSRSQNEVNTSDSQLQQRKTNLKCPLCRGTVLGLKVKDEVRKYLDLKIRTCSQESCSFTGNYHELRHHARRVHPKTRPSDIDPSRERAWNRLENQMEFGDIVSAIHSTTPGALVVGDYVIENENNLMENGNGGGFNEWWASFAMFQMIGSFENGSSSGRESRGLRPLSWRRNRWRDGNSSSNQRRRRRFWGRPRSRGDHHTQ